MPANPTNYSVGLQVSDHAHAASLRFSRLFCSAISNKIWLWILWGQVDSDLSRNSMGRQDLGSTPNQLEYLEGGGG